MQPYFQSLYEMFSTIHTDIRRAYAGLPPEALDWQPGPEMNSINALVVHLCGAQRYWIGDVVMGESSNRDRPAEFRTSGLSADQLDQRVDETEAYLQSAFERLSLADLEGERVSPRDQRVFQVGWSINHALEHTALHLGHLQIMRQMWDQR